MSLLSFQLPDKIVMEKADDFHGIFTFSPLQPGYGLTIGNAVRRVLLSSLEGYAITGIKIPGIQHEFSTIDGIVEDASEIILNLKTIRFKSLTEKPDNSVVVSFDKKGTLTAGDIAKSTSSYQVLNPDQEICTLSKKVKFSIELKIERGRGYVSSEENNSNSSDVDFISIDSVFTPIINVKYNIENTRVEQKTDFEKLILDIQTDGSIHPEDALKGSAQLLIKHFYLFSDKDMEFAEDNSDEIEVVDEELLHMRKLLKTSLNDLDLSVRAYNCLKAADIKTLGDLVSIEISDMMKFRNFGKKSLTELEELVDVKGLNFGMDLTKYNLD
ncbi:MAG: DNA-directed RNA polymerase subunit alpha [Flammeovirgaceae bacterium]|jgi:DNA-directed RNA polymerase subunit alpha|nr:DNA-directed RNA polymerase subunit alpha [Flammeovirgaceae bacterium]PDH50475.1 MAG: DNA-directed RNA polymerase subunit alpha [Rhodothermaeota bacterium MED-G16]|tara:strand:- start:2156 stop:3139 length:984 start_codon:yes stop_codon:yes gene_type:complete